MPSARQQRPARNRRQVTAANPPLIPALATVVASIALGTLDIQGLIVAQPPTAGGTAAPLQVSGIPQILRASTGGFPTVATLLPDGVTVRLEYAGGAVTAGEDFWVGINDPAIRTSAGQFLGSGRIASPAPLPPPVTPATWTAAATGANEVTVTVTGNGTDYTISSPTHWRKGPANTFPTAGTVPSDADGRSTYQLVLTYGDAVTPGDALAYEGPALAIGNTGVRTITTTPGAVI